MIPDCTLVTCCYILTEFNEFSRNMIENVESMETLLSVPCYLIIFCDSISIDKIKEIRNKYGFSEITYYIQKELHELKNSSYIEKIKQNREQYHPTKDVRTCPESHFICCSKFNFVLEAMDLDPFKTRKFGWIDSNVRQNFEKICTNYKSDMLLNVLHECNDQFNLQILNVCDKKYKKEECKKEMYERYRWIVCGCLFITTKEIGKKILSRLNEVFLKTTEDGYGHGEEMFYLEILDEFYEDIHRSYGDYNTILNNFIKQTVGFDYVYYKIIQSYLYFRYYKECMHCCEQLIHSYENTEVEMNYDLYFKILFAYYISSFYENINLAIEIVKKIRLLIQTNTSIKEIYENDKNYYDAQLKFCE